MERKNNVKSETLCYSVEPSQKGLVIEMVHGSQSRVWAARVASVSLVLVQTLALNSFFYRHMLLWLAIVVSDLVRRLRRATVMASTRLFSDSSFLFFLVSSIMNITLVMVRDLHWSRVVSQAAYLAEI